MTRNSNRINSHGEGADEQSLLCQRGDFFCANPQVRAQDRLLHHWEHYRHATRVFATDDIR
uniref:Uncharacterized protein n=1 Tax=Arundo donax TaxID=35708 RepID=A0A0A9T099_ARUDO